MRYENLETKIEIEDKKKKLKLKDTNLLFLNRGKMHLN